MYALCTREVVVTFPVFEDRATPRSFYPMVVVDVILDRLAQGEPLAHICATPSMPSRRTVYGWLADPTFFSRYQAAVQAGIHARALKSTPKE